MIWMGLMIACLVTLIVVPTTIAQAKADASEATDVHTGSATGWIISSIIGFVLWAFIIAALLGFGFNHGSSMGVGGLVANGLLFGGPALYVYRGYRQIQTANAWRHESSADPN